jgi:hypothetical protein
MVVKIDEICCDRHVDADLLTLLGIVNLNFNYAEAIPRIFVHEYLGLAAETADRIALNMNEQTLIGLCRAIVEEKEREEEVRQACATYLDIFNILSENRNIVIHALVTSQQPETVSLVRVARSGKPDTVVLLRDELSRFCKELRDLFSFGFSIWERYLERSHGGPHVKLLSAPPLPSKLHLRQINPNNDLDPP